MVEEKGRERERKKESHNDPLYYFDGLVIKMMGVKGKKDPGRNNFAYTINWHNLPPRYLLWLRHKVRQ